MHNNNIASTLGCLLALSLSQAALAQTQSVSWANWKHVGPTKVVGHLVSNTGTSVVVKFKGKYNFAQLDGGTNYWQPATPYLSLEITNAPGNSDIIGLNKGGTATLTFSEAVQDPLVALVSWNGNIVDFGVPIEVLSYGQGYWGNGTPVVNSTGTGFYGDGEVHGVIRLKGLYQSITFTHISEFWHGFTVGLPHVALSAAALNGTVNGLGPQTVTCLNNTTGQSVTFTAASDRGYDCQKAGLTITPSQKATITIKGALQ